MLVGRSLSHLYPCYERCAKFFGILQFRSIPQREHPHHSGRITCARRDCRCSSSLALWLPHIFWDAQRRSWNFVTCSLHSCSKSFSDWLFVLSYSISSSSCERFRQLSDQVEEERSVWLYRLDRETNEVLSQTSWSFNSVQCGPSYPTLAGPSVTGLWGSLLRSLLCAVCISELVRVCWRTVFNTLLFCFFRIMFWTDLRAVEGQRDYILAGASSKIIGMSDFSWFSRKCWRQLGLTTGSDIRAPVALTWVVAGVCREKRTGMPAGVLMNPTLVFEGRDIATCFSKIQPRLSLYVLLHGNTVNGSWRAVVAHMARRCLCTDLVAVTRLVESTCWLVTRCILRGCAVRSELIWAHCALVNKRLCTHTVLLECLRWTPKSRDRVPDTVTTPSVFGCMLRLTKAREKQCREACVVWNMLLVLPRMEFDMFARSRHTQFLDRSSFPFFYDENSLGCFYFCLVARQVKPQFMSFRVSLCTQNTLSHAFFSCAQSVR